ncbi:MAG: hypothetical protein AB7N70_09575 [Dehalococcoidia bacterium]
MKMNSRLQIRDIPEFCRRYERAHPGEDDELTARKARIRKEGRLRLDDLYELCRWKSPRAIVQVQRNTDAEVVEVTTLALRTRSERVRIEVLQMLYGVSYPMASVILHFYHRDRYPILDFRALWSLRINQPSQYTFEFWWRYVLACRQLREQSLRRFPGLSMRQLDRALWQYSYERQPRG